MRVGILVSTFLNNENFHKDDEREHSTFVVTILNGDQPEVAYNGSKKSGYLSSSNPGHISNFLPANPPPPPVSLPTAHPKTKGQEITLPNYVTTKF